jgi:hypothetical protein
MDDINLYPQQRDEMKQDDTSMQQALDWLKDQPANANITSERIAALHEELSGLNQRDAFLEVAARHGIMVVDHSGSIDSVDRVLKWQNPARIVDHDILGNPIYDPTEIAILNAPVPQLDIPEVPKDQPVLVVGGDGSRASSTLRRLALIESFGSAILGPNFVDDFIDRSIPARFKPKEPRKQTDADRLAMARAESKRLAKAAKLQKRGGK